MSEQRSTREEQADNPNVASGDPEIVSLSDDELTRNTNSLPAANTSSSQPQGQNDQEVVEVNDGTRRPRLTTSVIWRILSKELLPDNRKISSDHSSSPSSATASEHGQIHLPARPHLPPLRVAEPAEKTDKDSEEYRGMHPPQHAEAVTSPPEQTSLSDYSPWNGDAVEDQMSEQVIRSGYALKQPVGQETETARKTLSPYFRHPASLQNLSNIFASVLQQRHERGRMKESSTFKPPPRVTLTDTRREAWLNDLANPDVPLRKLSRTIPHGIRGRALLDQCLTKVVPISRAIWLAKCVGANELRAFRRKGISGAIMLENEQKWVREWTTVVEAFLEEISVFSAQPAWRQKLRYALRLISQFFAEGLLDRDHFLDWSLSQFEACDIENLPLRFLTIQITQQPLILNLRFGRRLASACISKLDELFNSPDKDLLLPLTDRLEQWIHTLALRRSDCLVVRKIWKRCRNTFIQHVEDVAKKSQTGTNRTPIPPAQNRLLLVLRRAIDDNDQIIRATDKACPPPDLPVLSIVDQLDGYESHLPIYQLARRCEKILPDVSRLVIAIVQWCTSLYRQGIDRIYLAARLIQHLRKEGHDTDGYILNGWQRFDVKSKVRSADLGRLLAELVRSGHFNATGFLRWLIARGGINDEAAPSGLQVLLDMPVSSIPANVASLRRMLLQGYRFQEPFANESSSLKPEIFEMLSDGAIATTKKGYKHDNLQTHLSSLNCSEIFEISDYIRRKFSLTSTEIQRDVPQHIPEDLQLENSKLTPAAIQRIVTVLNNTGDILTLADFLPSVILHSDTECLSNVANVVELRLEALSSAGAVESLGLKLCERYRSLRKTSPPTRELILSLASVCSRLHSCASLLPRLKQELASCEGSMGIAAHTPMSDVQAEAADENEFEFDSILHGNVILDSTHFNQAFDLAMLKLSKQPKDDQTQKILGAVINTIKTQHESAFQAALADWLREQYENDAIETFTYISYFLTGSNCYDVAALLGLGEQVCNEISATDPDTSLRGSLMMIGLFCSNHSHIDIRTSLYDCGCGLQTTCCPPFTRGTVAASRCVMDNYKALLPFLFRCVNPTLDFNSQVLALMRKDSILSIICNCIVHDFDMALKLVNCMSKAVFEEFIAGLVDPADRLGAKKLDNSGIVRLVFETVDGLSLPTYQFLLRVITSTSSWSEGDRASLDKLCLEALIQCQVKDCPFWRNLVSFLDVEAARQIGLQAERQLLFDVSKEARPLERIKNQTSPDARYLSAIVEATAFSAKDETNMETARNIESQLSYAISLMDGRFDLQSKMLEQWMQAICHIILIRGKSCAMAGTLTNVVQALCGLMARDSGLWTAQTLKGIFDAAAFLIEELPAPTFIQIRNNLGQSLRHGTVRFLFGVTDNPDGWLFATKLQQIQANQQTQNQDQVFQPFPLRRWELLPDLAQNSESNDTALSMRLFDATKI